MATRCSGRCCTFPIRRGRSRRCAQFAIIESKLGKVPYRPFLDDPAARLRLVRAKQPWTGRVSVPMLFTESEVARN